MDQELPEEVLAALAEHEEKDSERLAALGISLTAKRKEAVAARKDSGIEDVWLKAEEAYLGIDETNRSAFSGARWAKPTTMEGPVTTGFVRQDDSEVKSTAYVRLTSRYVDAGVAKLGEILLPAGEDAFSFTSTPVPDLINGLKNMDQAVHNGIKLTKPAPPVDPNSVPQGPNMGQPIPSTSPDGTQPIPGATVPVTVKDVAEEAIEMAQKSAEKAKKRISDWMVQSQYRREMRKVIFDRGRIGVGVLKGPFPRSTTSKAFSQETKTLTIVRKTAPAYEWKDPWGIFPDPACGENIHNGDHLFEYDQFSRKQIRALKKDPGYIKEAIDKVLSLGPSGSAPEAQKPGDKINKNLFPVWHFYGTISRDDMILAGGLKKEEKTPDEVYAIVTMVNDIVIRATMNPLDSGEFPYHSVPWQRRAGHWAGVGIAEQLEMPQRAINAAIRSLFNNAGKSAGSTIVLDRGAITPADKTWTLTPDKIFYKSADATSDDVRKAFAFFQVPNMGPQLMAIIELCFRLAEESTNIPLITQGQSGPTTPDTFGAAQLQNNNANQLLRSVGYTHDDFITEPVVNQSYEYLLLDPSVPDDEKGDWEIDAHGSVALVERAIQDQTIQQMGNFAINPAFGVNPKKWFAEFSKTKHLNPRNFQYTEEEQAKIDSQPKAAAPAIEVAKIKSADAEKALQADQQLAGNNAALQQALEKMDADTKLQIAAMRKEVEQLRIQKDTDRDTAFVQAQTDQTVQEGEARMREIEAKIQLATLEYANKKDMKLMDVKKQLADTSMRLNVQKELATLGHAVELRKHDTPDVQEVIPPAAEPAGKAPAGESFTR